MILVHYTGKMRMSPRTNLSFFLLSLPQSGRIWLLKYKKLSLPNTKPFSLWSHYYHTKAACLPQYDHITSLSTRHCAICVPPSFVLARLPLPIQSHIPSSNLQESSSIFEEVIISANSGVSSGDSQHPPWSVLTPSLSCSVLHLLLPTTACVTIDGLMRPRACLCLVKATWDRAFVKMSAAFSLVRQ